MNDNEMRLDVWVAAHEGLPRTRAQQLIADGHVLVNGAPGKKNDKVGDSDAITVHVPEVVEMEQDPLHVPFELVYRDDHLAVVNKPAGVIVHRAQGMTTPTLVEALSAAGLPLAPRGGDDRPGIVHRLDRMTSGLLLVALDDATHAGLQEQLRLRHISRTYWAAVWGTFDESRGTITMPIARDPARPTLRRAHADGKPSTTHFSVLTTGRGASILDVTLETGRTHQIRVHLAAIHHPVIGDAQYGRRDDSFAPRTALHARAIRFEHPVTHATMEFTAPLPSDLERLSTEVQEGQL